MLAAKQGRAGGQWWPVKYADGSLSATLYCPECQRAMSLKNHAISGDGYVSPSVVCPHVTCPHCRFHEFVRLVGWSKLLDQSRIYTI